MASLSRDEVAHVARLARLQLPDEEIDRFTPQLAAILDHAADVEELDLCDVANTGTPAPMVKVRRPALTRRAEVPGGVEATGPGAGEGVSRATPQTGGGAGAR